MAVVCEFENSWASAPRGYTVGAPPPPSLLLLLRKRVRASSRESSIAARAYVHIAHAVLVIKLQLELEHTVGGRHVHTDVAPVHDL